MTNLYEWGTDYWMSGNKKYRCRREIGVTVKKEKRGLYGDGNAL